VSLRFFFFTPSLDRDLEKSANDTGFHFLHFLIEILSDRNFGDEGRRGRADDGCGVDGEFLIFLSSSLESLRPHPNTKPLYTLVLISAHLPSSHFCSTTSFEHRCRVIPRSTPFPRTTTSSRATATALATHKADIGTSFRPQRYLPKSSSRSMRSSKLFLSRKPHIRLKTLS